MGKINNLLLNNKGEHSGRESNTNYQHVFCTIHISTASTLVQYLYWYRYLLTSTASTNKRPLTEDIHDNNNEEGDSSCNKKVCGDNT